MPERESDLLEIIENSLALFLVESGAVVKRQLAGELSAEFIQNIRDSYGGDRYWLSASQSRRYKSIQRRFDGSNGAELMREFGISRATFYRDLSK